MTYREEGKDGKNHSFDCCSLFTMVSLAQKVILETGEERRKTLVHVIVRDVLLQVVIWSLQVKIQNECYCKKYKLFTSF